MNDTSKLRKQEEPSRPQKRIRETPLKEENSRAKETLAEETTPFTWQTACSKDERDLIKRILKKHEGHVGKDIESILQLFTRKLQDRIDEKTPVSNKSSQNQSQVIGSEDLGHLLCHFKQLNFLVPRKKLEVEVYKKGLKMISHERRLERQILASKVKSVLKLSFASVNTKKEQHGFVWIVEETPGDLDPLVMTIMEDTPLEIKREDEPEMTSISTIRFEEFLVSYFQRDLLSIDVSLFSSSTDLKSFNPCGVPCYQKNKEGSLFLLKGGDIYFGWKKPFIYIELKFIERIDFLSLTSRTFDILVVKKSSIGDSIRSSSEFSLIEYQYFDVISRYLQIYYVDNNLRELSSATSRLGKGESEDNEKLQGSSEDSYDEDYDPSKGSEEEI